LTALQPLTLAEPRSRTSNRFRAAAPGESRASLPAAAGFTGLLSTLDKDLIHLAAVVAHDLRELIPLLLLGR